jgi:hypothetical protein
VPAAAEVEVVVAVGVMALVAVAAGVLLAAALGVALAVGVGNSAGDVADAVADAVAGAVGEPAGAKKVIGAVDRGVAVGLAARAWHAARVSTANASSASLRVNTQIMVTGIGEKSKTVAN